MEICQCGRYREIAEKFNFYSLGTIHPLLPRIPVPQNACITWKCNKANHDDSRPNKPILVLQSREVEEREIKHPEPLEAKWIPVLPGVISQKSVNECKNLHSPF